MPCEELTAEMNRRCSSPAGPTPTPCPSRARVDMLTTGVRTPVGVKVMGTNLAEIEKIGVELERLLAPVPGTRSVYYERNTGGLYLDIYPGPRRPGPLRPHRGRREAGHRGGHRRRPDRHHGGGAQPLLDQRALPAGPAQRPGAAAAGAGPGGRRRRGGGGGGGMGGTGSLARRPRMPRAACWRRWAAAAAPAARPGGRGGGERHATPQPRLVRAQLPAGAAPARRPRARGRGQPPAAASFVPLGQVADIRIAGGPPMIRDDGGLLVGYVYVDIDTGTRDVGGYVDEAKEVVAGGPGRRPPRRCRPATSSSGPASTSCMEKMAERHAAGHPAHAAPHHRAAALLHFRNFTEVLIVLLSIPFALVGSVWLLWAARLPPLHGGLGRASSRWSAWRPRPASS